MKEISNEEVKKLIDKKYIKFNGRNYIDQRGIIVSYYRTHNKRYIEDKYAEIAKRIS